MCYTKWRQKSWKPPYRMAIDYIIDYSCTPKETLSTAGILERLKGEERAQAIIQLFRRNGDDRSPSEMGFEFTRSTPEGQEETRVIVVQDLLDEAAELKPLEHHCEGCPANIGERPFGCMGFIQYPISQRAENWLLDQLPVPDEPLVWMLLRQGIQEFEYDGHSVRPLRNADRTYFEEPSVRSRRLGEFTIDANQLFEMIFGVGNIQPNHGALILLFVHAISREIEAHDIMNIAPAPEDVEKRHPFLFHVNDSDDQTIGELKQFFLALYTSWKLNISLILDA